MGLSRGQLAVRRLRRSPAEIFVRARVEDDSKASVRRSRCLEYGALAGLICVWAVLLDRALLLGFAGIHFLEDEDC